LNSKQYYLAVILILLISSCGNRKNSISDRNNALASDTGTAVIVFREYSHDFGRVVEGEKVAHIFTFENTGSSNLVLNRVTTSCGCTAPNYDTKPIAPGKAGNVEVVYNAEGMDGMQTKTITVKSNASVPVVLLRITAEVYQATNN